MSMSRNFSDTDIDNEPHTLRSIPQSKALSILGSSHRSLLSESNPLQISQSPSRFLNTEPSKGFPGDTQTPSTTNSSQTQDKKTCCYSTPQDTSVFSYTTNEEKSSQSCDQQVTESMIDKAKSSDENVLQHCKTSISKEYLANHSPSEAPVSNLSHKESLSATACIDSPQSIALSHSSCSPLPEHNISNVVVNSSPSMDSSDSSAEFFSFVILHVPLDQEAACRVCTLLQDLGVGSGTTFCEGFETPGVSPLTCLEHAVESSAYIVLLMTNAFLSNWGMFQTNTVLMNSIEDVHKLGTVIPFYPSLNKASGKIPLSLKSLFALEESSSLFKQKVRKTFRQDVIKRHHARWIKEQNLRRHQRSVQEYADNCNYLQQLQNISLQNQNFCSPQCLQWPVVDPTSMPHLIQNPHAMFHGQAPVIQISHVGNVQIGNQNSMIVHEVPNESQMDLYANSYQDGTNEAPN